MSRKRTAAGCLGAAAAAALLAVPAAQAKLRMTLAVAPAAPRAHAPVRVELRADRPLERDAVMRLYAVAPGAGVMDVVATFTGGSYVASPRLRDSFRVQLRRVSRSVWRATFRFPRAGTWQLVVPNFGAPGYALPPPLVRPIRVR